MDWNRQKLPKIQFQLSEKHIFFPDQWGNGEGYYIRAAEVGSDSNNLALLPGARIVGLGQLHSNLFYSDLNHISKNKVVQREIVQGVPKKHCRKQKKWSNDLACQQVNWV